MEIVFSWNLFKVNIYSYFTSNIRPNTNKGSGGCPEVTHPKVIMLVTILYLKSPIQSLTLNQVNSVSCTHKKL